MQYKPDMPRQHVPCVLLATGADNVSMPHVAATAINQYLLLPAGLTATSAPHVAAAGELNRQINK